MDFTQALHANNVPGEVFISKHSPYGMPSSPAISRVQRRRCGEGQKGKGHRKCPHVQKEEQSIPSAIILSLTRGPGSLLLVSALSASPCSGSLASHTGSLHTRSAASWRLRRPGSPCQPNAFQTPCWGCCQRAGGQNRFSYKTLGKSSYWLSHSYWLQGLVRPYFVKFLNWLLKQLHHELHFYRYIDTLDHRGLHFIPLF